MDDSLARKATLLRDWHECLRVLHRANFMAAAHYTRRHRAFGVIVIAATSIVGSAIFATMGDSAALHIQIIAGFISLTATVLSSMQTFLAYGELASAHKQAALRYGDLRREVEILQSQLLEVVPDLDQRLTTIHAQWTQADKEFPPLPEGLFDATRKAILQAGEVPPRT